MTYERSPNTSRKQIVDSFDTVFANTLQNIKYTTKTFLYGSSPRGCRCPSLFKSLLSMALLDIFGELAINSANCADSCAPLCDAGGFQIGVTVIFLSIQELMTLIDHHLFPSTCTFRNVCLNFVRFLRPILFLFLHSLWPFTRSARLTVSIIPDFRFSIPLLCSFGELIYFFFCSSRLVPYCARAVHLSHSHRAVKFT